MKWLLGIALVVIFGAAVYFILRNRIAKTGGTLDISAAEKKSQASDAIVVEKGKGKGKL